MFFEKLDDVMRVWLLVVLSLLLSACSWSNFPFLYKPNVQQGNVIEQDNVSQLKVGMNKDAVMYYMGNPILVNVLSPSRELYVYTYKPGKKDMTEQKVILTFENDKLIKIER